MPRITATEMVSPSFTTREVQRLLDALADGRLGPPGDVENVALHKKLTVLLQAATAAEKRRASMK